VRVSDPDPLQVGDRPAQPADRRENGERVLVGERVHEGEVLSVLDQKGPDVATCRVPEGDDPGSELVLHGGSLPA
jgi:hypothetical protein